MALVVVLLLFLAPLLHRHVVAYGTSSDSPEEPVMHHVAANTAYNGA